MLHIILLILKIIGFVVLGLLALILLLVLILLLAPMTCTVNGRIDNSLESLEGQSALSLAVPSRFGRSRVARW